MKKLGLKLHTFLLTLVILAGVFPVFGQFPAVPANAVPWGTGASPSSSAPWIIMTADQLNQVRNHTSGHFVLGANINLATTHNPWTPIPTFTGTFNGNGHIVHNVNIIGDRQIGFFGILGNGGRVENLGLNNVAVSGNSELGGLVGDALGGAHIVGCFITNGNIIGSTWAGGLVGNNAGSINNSFFEGAVRSIGGAGDWVSGIGGLVGQSAGPILNSYANATVTLSPGSTLHVGVGDMGGLIGNSVGGTVTHSYHNSANLAGGTGEFRADADMRNLPNSSFPNWDFALDNPDAWARNSGINDGFPFLQIFGIRGNLPCGHVWGEWGAPVHTPATCTAPGGNVSARYCTLVNCGTTPRGRQTEVVGAPLLQLPPTSVARPTFAANQTFPFGSSHTVEITHNQPNWEYHYAVSGTTTSSAVGAHTTTISLTSPMAVPDCRQWDGGGTGDITITWEITRATGSGTVSVAGWTFGDVLDNIQTRPQVAGTPQSYTGTPVITFRRVGTTEWLPWNATNISTTTAAGDYEVRAVFPQTTNHNSHEAMNTFTIARKEIAPPTANTGLIFNNAVQTGVNTGTEFSLTGNTATNAGNHSATATLDANHQWNSGDNRTQARNIPWSIATRELTVTASSHNIQFGAALPNNFTVEITGFATGHNIDNIGLTGHPLLQTVFTTANTVGGLAYSAGSPVGTYNITPNVSDLAATNYRFTPANGTLTVSARPINDASVAIAINVSSTHTYTGVALTPTYTVTATIDGTQRTLERNTDFTSAYTNNTAAGNATITITGIGNYAGGERTQTFNIARRPLTISGFNITKQFDGLNTIVGGFGTLVFTVGGENGLQNSETANVASTVVTATYGGNLVNPAHPITFSGNFTMTGGTANSANYIITQPTGITGAITLFAPNAPPVPRHSSSSTPHHISDNPNSITIIVPLNAPHTATPMSLVLEYGISNSAATPPTSWQDGLTFDGLAPNTEYFFFARYKANTEKNSVSLASTALSVRTADLGITINPQPASATPVIFGAITSSLTVGATANGAADLTYQWFRNTTNSNTGGTPILDATGTTLNIPTNLIAGQHYFYVVVTATSTVGTRVVTLASNVATVTVAKAVVTRPTIATGQTFTFTGLSQTVILANTEHSARYSLTTQTQTNAGNHTVTATLNDPANFEWAGGTTDLVGGNVVLSWTIERAPLTITAPSETITFGDPVPTWTVENLTFSSFVNNETRAVLGGTANIATTYQRGDNVGTPSITVSGLTSTNYNITFVPGTLTVNRRDISGATVSTTFNPTFNGSAHTIAPTNITVTLDPLVSGFEFNPLLAATPRPFSVTAHTDNTNASNPPASLAGFTVEGTGNFTGTASGTFTINPADPTTVTFPTGLSLTYGETLGSISLAGGSALVAGEFEFVDPTTLPTVAQSNSHDFPIRFVPTSSNYATVNSNVKITVDRAVLTITAADNSVVFGAANPNPITTWSASGFINDNQAYKDGALTGTPLITTTRTSASNVGGYTITIGAGSLSAANYSFEFENATLTVNPAIINPAVDVTTPAVAVARGTATPTGADASNFSVTTETWNPNHNPFQGGQTYSVTVVLTRAGTNHTFTGLTTATINEHNATVSANTGNTVTLSYNFTTPTGEATLASIAVHAQPARLTYTHGDELALTGLIARLTYNDGTTRNVALSAFAADNITTDIENGTPLIRAHPAANAHHDKPITLSVPNPGNAGQFFTAITNNLTVSQKQLTWNVGSETNRATANPKPFDGNTTATHLNSPSLSEIVLSDAVTVRVGELNFADSAPATHAITATGWGIEGAAAGNYLPPNNGTGTENTQPFFANAEITQASIGTPTILGTVRIGETLTANMATHTGTTFTFEWFHADVSGDPTGTALGAGATYVIKGSDVEKQIVVIATAVEGGNHSGSANSTPTGAVPFTIRLERTGNIETDDVFFETTGNMNNWAAHGATVNFNYVLANLGTLHNRITYTPVELGISQVSAAGSGISPYTVDRAHADAGIITITATFSHEHSVTWHYDGGTPAPTQATVDHNGTIAAPANITKTAHTHGTYRFDGWFGNSAMTGTEITFPIQNVTAATKLWAKWTRLYNLTVTAAGSNGTVGGTAAGAYIADYSVNITATPNANYRFVNWTVTGITPPLAEAALTASPLTFGMPTNAVAVTANFALNNHTITWNHNNAATSPAVITTTTVEHNGNIAAGETATARTGCEFVAWFSNSDLANANRVTFPVNNITAPREFWAGWRGISLTQTTQTSLLSPHDFGKEDFNYAPITPLSITITNLGNLPTDDLTVELSGTGASSFTLSTLTISSIAADGTPTFTVVPNHGLSVGKYTATVTVSNTTNNISEKFDVIFEVEAIVIDDPDALTVAAFGAFTFNGALQTPLGGAVTFGTSPALTVPGSWSPVRNVGDLTEFTPAPDGNFTFVSSTGVTLSKDPKMIQRDIALADIATISSVRYTGAQHTPAPTVTDNVDVGGTLTNIIASSDFDVSHGANIVVGTDIGSVTITATTTGNYSGSKTANFTIEKMQVGGGSNPNGDDVIDINNPTHPANVVLRFPTAGDITYPAALGTAVLSGAIGENYGDFAWVRSDAATHTPNVGDNQSFAMSFTPNALGAANINWAAGVAGWNGTAVVRNVSVNVKPAPITAVGVTGVVPPVVAVAPSNAANRVENTYTVTSAGATWDPAHNPFQGGEAYTVSVTFQANDNHIFASSVSATINGEAATPVSRDDVARTITFSYKFSTTDSRTLAGIAITTPPTKMSYVHGEFLDLTDLSATLSYDDGTAALVSLTNFADSNITLSINGANVNLATPERLVHLLHDDYPLVVSIPRPSPATGNFTASTSDLTVAKRGLILYSAAHTREFDGGNTIGATNVVFTFADYNTTTNTGVVSGEVVNVATYTAVYTSVDAATTTINVSAITLGGTAEGNYTIGQTWNNFSLISPTTGGSIGITPRVITSVAISGITQPVRDATPVAAAPTATGTVTGGTINIPASAITWSPAHTSFLSNTSYTAGSITLTADNNHVFASDVAITHADLSGVATNGASITPSGTPLLRTATVAIEFVQTAGAVISIETHPTSRQLTYGGITATDTLGVVATVDGGAERSYQWFWNTTASSVGGTAILGATSATFAIPDTLEVNLDGTPGTHFFFVEVRATLGATAQRSNPATITINPRPLTVAGTTVTQSKTYDGNDAAVITVHGDISAELRLGDVQYTDQATVAADVVGVRLTATATFASPDVNNVLDANTITITYAIAGSRAHNYTAPASTNNTSGNITRRPVTITPHAATKVYGEADPLPFAFTPSETIIAGNTQTGGLNRYDNTNNDVGAYPFIRDNLSWGTNYDLTLATGTDVPVFTITAAPITSVAVIDVVEPEVAQAPQSTANAVGSTYGVTPAGATWSPTHNPFRAGETYTVSVTLSANKNHIFPALPTVITGTINGETATVARTGDGTIKLARAIAATGTATVTSITVETQPNLSYTHGDKLNLSELKAELHYDDGTSRVVAFADFGANNITTDVADDIQLIRHTHNNTSIAVIFDNSATIRVNTNNLTIAAKNIAITATASNKEYDGNTNATITLSATPNFISTPAPTITHTSATFDNASVGTGKTVTVSGLSLIAPSDANAAIANNYSITNASATATTTANITARELTIQSVRHTKVFDGSTTATGVEIIFDGILGTDEVSATATTANYTSRNAGTVAMNLTGITLTGAQAGNYSIAGTWSGNVGVPTPVAITTAGITAKPISITSVRHTKVYDGGVDAVGVEITLDGVVSPDDVSATATAVYTSRNAGTTTINISAVSLSGTGSVNYSIEQVWDGLTVGIPTPVAITTAGITKKPITITPDANQGKEFGTATDPAITFTVSPALISPDAFETGTALTRAPGTAVNRYNIDIGTLAINDGNNGDNYDITLAEEVFTITPTAINPVRVIGVVAPMSDSIRSQTADVPSGITNYSVHSVSWSPVPAGNIFSRGGVYTVQVVLEAASDFVFVNDASFVWEINGQTAIPSDFTTMASPVIGNAGNRVTLSFTFPATLTYGMTVAPALLDFGERPFGYTSATVPQAQLITVTNTGTGATGNLDITVLPADLFVITPAPGTPATFSVAAGAGQSGTISVQPAMALGYGTHIATITISGGSHDIAAQTVEATFVVGKADPEVVFPTDLTAVYLQNLSNVSLPGNGTSVAPGTFVWVVPENPNATPIVWITADANATAVGEVGQQTHTLRFVPDDLVNFSSPTSPVNVQVSPAPITLARIMASINVENSATNATVPLVGDKASNAATIDGITPANSFVFSGVSVATPIVWTPELSPTNMFRGGVIYTATVTLTAGANFTFNATTNTQINGSAAGITYISGTVAGDAGNSITISRTFTETGARTATDGESKIEIVSLPTIMSYDHGDELDLAGFTARITFNDGTYITDIVPANFAANNITIANIGGESVYDGMSLIKTIHDDQPLVLNWHTHTANSNDPDDLRAPTTPATLTVDEIDVGDEIEVAWLGAPFIFNSEPHRPTFTVKLDGEELTGTAASPTATVADTYDFSFEFSNNINAALATATTAPTLTITLRNNFSGTRVVKFTIEPLPVVITPASNQEKIFGQADPTFTFASDIPNTPAGLSGNFTAAIGNTVPFSRETGENVRAANYRFVNIQSSAAGSNYTLSLHTTPVTFEIKPLPVTITPKAGLNKTYGETEPTFGTVDDHFTADWSSTLNITQTIAMTFTGGIAREAGENVRAANYLFTGLGTAPNGLSAGDNFALNFANPSNIVFEIKPAVITISGFNISKPFDGTNAVLATCLSNLTFTGLVNGETANVNVAGVTATYNNAEVGTDKAITFSGAFGMTPGTTNPATPGNYTITQPTNIRGIITAGFSPIKGPLEAPAPWHYSITEPNANGWINTDFVITARTGYQLSLTNTADNTAWSNTLTRSAETHNGSISFFVRRTSDGAISAEATETYKIDKTDPSATITIDATDITYTDGEFKYFLKNTATATINATDNLAPLGTNASGVAKIEFHTSETQITLGWNALTWTDGTSVNLSANWKGFIYARITDVAGNVSIIGSDGIVVYTDAAPPATANIRHVRGATTPDSERSVAITLNGNTVAGIANDATSLTSAQFSVNASGVITFTADYLNTLATGTHTLTVSYNPFGETFVMDGINVAPATSAITLTIVQPITIMGDDITYSGKVFDGNTNVVGIVLITPDIPVQWKNAAHIVTVSFNSANPPSSFNNADAGSRTVTFAGLALGGTHASYYELTSTTATKTGVEIIPDTIRLAKITVTAPATGVAPSDAYTIENSESDEYDGDEHFTVASVSWTPADNPFVGGEEYTVSVVLQRLNANFTFENGLDGIVEINGETATSISIAPDGFTATLTYKFGATTAPEITIGTQPVNRTVTYGDTHPANLLSVAATVNNTAATISYQWYRSENIYRTGTQTPVGTNSANFIIPPNTVVGTYFYYVVVSAGLGAAPKTSDVATITVNQRPLTITGVNAINRNYDGTDVVALTGGTLQGLVNPTFYVGNIADFIGFTPGNGTVSNKNVGDNKAVTTNITLTGSSAGNYILTQPTGITVNITARPLTVEFTADEKIYDGNTSATILTRSVFLGLVAGDENDVEVVGGTATFDNRNVGTAKTVTATGFTLSGTASGNYTIQTINTTTANITARPIIITPDALISKIFGETDPVLTYTYEVGAPLSAQTPVPPALVGGDAFTGALSRVLGETVGDSPYNILRGDLEINDGNSGNNYNITITTGITFAITRKSIYVPVAITGLTYNSTPQVGITTVNGGVGYTEAGQSANAHTNGTATAAGTHTIRVTVDGNHYWNAGASLVLYRDIDFTIEKAVPQEGDQFTIPTGLTAVFHDQLSVITFTGSYDGWEWVIPTDLVGNVGNREHEATFIHPSGNYSAIIKTLTVNVIPFEIVITPDAGQHKEFGDPEPSEFTFDHAPALFGADETDFKTNARLARIAGETVGTHAFALGNLQDVAGDNYKIVMVGNPETFEIRGLDINDPNIIVEPIADETFTGLAIEPTVVISRNGTPLVKDVDFTVSFSANVDVGTVTITISGAGNVGGVVGFSGTRTTTFEIVPLVITITPDADQYKVLGDAEPAVFTFTHNPALIGADETNFVDYAYLDRESGETIGTYEFTLNNLQSIAGSNYEIVMYANAETFEIKGLDIGDGSIVIASIDDQPFTSLPITPILELSRNGTALVEGLDFTVSFSADNVNVGIVIITINGINGFSGTTTTTFKIVPLDIVITPDAGQEKLFGDDDPTEFTFAHAPILFGADETNFTANARLARVAGETVGTHAFILGNLQVIAGDNYNIVMVAAPATFAINGLDISDASIEIEDIADQVFTGLAITPTVEISRKGLSLEEGVDFSVSFGANVNVGIVSVMITGIGGFSGDTTITFNIVPLEIVITPDVDQSKVLGDADPAVFTFTHAPILRGNGGADETDFATNARLERATGETVGTYAFTLGNLQATAGNNYAIVMVDNPATFAITGLDISDGSIIVADIAAHVFTGLAITPTIELSRNGTALVEGVDFTVAFSPNINVGTVEITITGIGGFSGTTTTSFEIVPFEIVITPDADQNKLFGDEDPIFTFTHNPTLVVAADEINFAANARLGRADGETVGIYAFTLGNLQAVAGANYTIVMVNDPETFEIKGLDISDGSIEIADIAAHVFTGLAITPTVEVSRKGLSLVEGVDFAVAFSANVNVGTVEITITGIGGFSGDTTITFEILPLQITITPDADQSKEFGEDDPIFTFTHSPALIGNDTFTGALERVEGEAIGDYEFVLGTLSAGSNYELVLADDAATFEIIDTAPCIHVWGDWSDWDIITPASCDAPGMMTRARVCVHCAIVNESTRLIAQLNGDNCYNLPCIHVWSDWSDWSVIKPATCELPGMMERVRLCTLCSVVNEVVRLIAQLNGNNCYDPSQNRDAREACDGERYGIVLENAVVRDSAIIRVIVPEVSKARIGIFDATGNLLFDSSKKSSKKPVFGDEHYEIKTVWNLSNKSGRMVANGTYLIVVQVRGESGKIHQYSARIGVRR